MLVSCRAQVLQAQRPAPTAPDALGPPLIAALNGHDFASFEGLLHSRTRACLTTQTRPYFDAIFARQTRRPLAPSAEVRVTPLPSDRAPASDGFVRSISCRSSLQAPKRQIAPITKSIKVTQ